MRGETFARRLLLSVDAVGYGSRDDRRQRVMQTAIRSVLDSTAEQVGLDRSHWRTQRNGDSELAILPAEQADTEPVLVEDYVRELHTALSWHNEDLRDEARLRLRLAIHNGVAKPADNGYAGQGVVAVSRLVEAHVAKEVMREVPSASLVVILSERVFLDVVAQGHVSLPPRLFRRVSVRNKEFEQTAYLYLPGHDVHGTALREQTGTARQIAGTPSAPTDSTPMPTDRTNRQDATSGSAGTPGAHTTFYGPVDAPGAVIGIQWNN